MLNTNQNFQSGEAYSPLALYVHIPFCYSKCAYCDFLSFPKTNQRQIDDYLLALEFELQNIKIMQPVTSIFIGGGTPSILSIEQLQKLLSMITKYICLDKNVEFTIEANPGTVTKEKLACMKEFQINRISFGVQTFQEQLRRDLGRMHTVEQAIESIQLAQQAGFQNINVDLMLGLAGQTERMLEQSIEQAIQLNVTHISAYALIVEENTQLFDQVRQGHVLLPDDDFVADMLDFTEKKLTDSGFLQYELSNFAKMDQQCKHNIVYWTMQNYIGIGLGSAGAMWDDGRLIRKKNTSDWTEYMQAGAEKKPISTEIEYIEGEDLVFERIMLGLRMNEGITWREFEERFSCDIQKTHQKAIDKNNKNGLLYIDEKGMQLTKAGRRLQNIVLLDFME